MKTAKIIIPTNAWTILTGKRDSSWDEHFKLFTKQQERRQNAGLANPRSSRIIGVVGKKAILNTDKISVPGAKFPAILGADDDPSKIGIEIRDTKNRVVKNMSFTTWDFTDNQGTVVSPGEYLYKIIGTTGKEISKGSYSVNSKGFDIQCDVPRDVNILKVSIEGQHNQAAHIPVKQGRQIVHVDTPLKGGMSHRFYVEGIGGKDSQVIPARLVAKITQVEIVANQDCFFQQEDQKISQSQFIGIIEEA